MINNYFGSSSHRNPLIKCKRGRVVNNIIYNYDFRATHGSTALAVNGRFEWDFVNNLYKAGPQSEQSIREHSWNVEDSGGGQSAGLSLYVVGHIGPNHADPDTDPWNDVVYEADGHENNAQIGVLDTSHQRLTPLAAPTYPINAQPTTGLENVILRDVGASRQLDCTDGSWRYTRDSTDARMVQDYYDGTGATPADEVDVGGFPTIGTSPAACTDTDNDGIPDAIETALGSNPSVADATGDLDGDGYDNIEEYINGPIPCHLIEHGDAVPTVVDAPYVAAEAQYMMTEVWCNDLGAQIWVVSGGSIADRDIYDTAWVCEGSLVDPSRYLCDVSDWQTVSLSGLNKTGSYFSGRAWSGMLPLTRAEIEDSQADVVLTYICDAGDCGFQRQVLRRG